MATQEEIEKRRRQVWIYYNVGGYTEPEIASKLGVSRRTISRDRKYLKEHPEEIPSLDRKAFSTYVFQKIFQLIEEGAITDWQALKKLTALARSQTIKQVKKQGSLDISWGKNEGRQDSEE